jgi:hypothetical protein
MASSTRRRSDIQRAFFGGSDDVDYINGLPAVRGGADRHDTDAVRQSFMLTLCWKNPNARLAGGAVTGGRLPVRASCAVQSKVHDHGLYFISSRGGGDGGVCVCGGGGAGGLSEPWSLLAQ